MLTPRQEPLDPASVVYHSKPFPPPILKSVYGFSQGETVENLVNPCLVRVEN